MNKNNRQKKKDEDKKLEIRELTLKHGLFYPSEVELIMLILGSGTRKLPVRELSHKVLETIMSSNKENLIQNLLKIRGVGTSKALMIASALELGRRLDQKPKFSLCSPSDIIPYIQNYSMMKQEHFLCISLNGAREIISIRVICSGVGNMAIVRASEVFSEAVKEHASAVVISHNHPSENITPSRADIETTHRLFKAAEILGIVLLDHIIIAKSGYYSFLEHGILDEEKMSNLLLEDDF
ncbi:RadC family protein [Treponema sp.]|uniref:JAB domain-containing protein n=1 Tax=Treponema sp. TaxID=166 RepID=UPI00388CFC49